MPQNLKHNKNAMLISKNGAGINSGRTTSYVEIEV